MKISISMRGEGQGSQTGFFDRDAQFLMQFADQGLFGAFMGLNFAAGKFP